MKKIFIILITIALIAVTVFFHQRKENRENTEMERFAQFIADESDDVFENATLEIIDEIKNDNLTDEDSISHRIETHYFKKAEIFKNYDIVASVCDSNTYFNYNDASFSCLEYFKELMSINKSKEISDELYNIDEPTPNTYYLAKININDSQILFVEFYKEKNAITNLKNYSFGIFNNDILHYKVGNYLYPNNINNFISQEAGLHKGKKFKHLILNDLENGKAIVVSIESERWMRYVAPFSLSF